MRNQLKGIFLGALIGGVASFFWAREIYISEANGYLFSQRASLAKDIVRVMNHVEEKADITNLNGADCDVYVEYYSLIRSYLGEVEKGHFIIHGEDKSSAIDAISESLATLESYRNRSGEQDCSDAQVPI